MWTEQTKGTASVGGCARRGASRIGQGRLIEAAGTTARPSSRSCSGETATVTLDADTTGWTPPTGQTETAALKTPPTNAVFKSAASGDA